MAWDRRDSDRFLGITAEFLNAAEGYRPIAAVDLSGIAELPRQSQTTEVQLRIDAFVETVNGFLSKLAPPTYRDNL